MRSFPKILVPFEDLSDVCIGSHFIALLSINSSQADGKHFVLAVMNSTRLCRPVLEHLFSGCSLKNWEHKK